MSLVLGDGNGERIRLSDAERRRHVHVIGASGTGKSKLLEHMVRTDIQAGRGLCLIDPHGTLADAVVAWCASRGIDELRRVHVVHAAELAWSLGFNPLRLDGRTETQARVDAMVAACAQVWGGEDTRSTPLLRTCLQAVFYALAENRLSLTEAPLLTNGAERTLRLRLTASLPNPVFAALWGDFNRLKHGDFFEQFASTNRRLLEFLASPVIRRIVGQQERALDLRSIMDRDEILIVNLAGREVLSRDKTQLLGTLLTSELFLLALARDQATARDHPFTLYLDECHRFLTSDIPEMLEEARKFGLQLVLAHQSLDQLNRHGEAIYRGVLAGGQTKIVFGGLMDQDAEVLAREVFRSSFDLERPKHSLDKPVVVDERPVWLLSESWSESEAVGVGTGEGSSSGTASGLSGTLAQSFDPRGVQLLGTVDSASSSEVSTEGSNSSRSRSETYANAHAWGRSQTLKPVRETMVTAVHSPEEELHRAILALRELPVQAAVVKRPGKAPIRFRPPHVRDALVSSERVEAFVERSRASSPYIGPAEDAEAEIRTRIERLKPESEALADLDFWTPEQ